MIGPLVADKISMLKEQRPTVLVMEADRDVRELLTFTLEHFGFSAVSSQSRERVTRERPAAIVSGLSAHQFAQWRARQIDAYHDLPVIEVEKPFSPREVVARVRAHLNAA
jgi:hypothetical protein